MKDIKEYKYKGARSLVILHDTHLRSCVKTWREAKKFNIILPATEDEYYKSLDTLLFHILRSARNYMVWCCEKLELPDPGIDNPPQAGAVEAEADKYLTHLLEKWKTPLALIEEEKFHTPSYKSRWGVDFCIDAMLEHAVMHPIRHEFQLKNLINEQAG